MPNKKKRNANVARPRNKPVPRAIVVQDTTAHITTVEQDELLAMMGVELWRLAARAKRTESAPAMDSYERLMRLFTQVGGRVEDRTGERFVDGQVAEVLHQPDGTDPGSHRLVIAETVRPAVFVHDRCVIVPQVILEHGVPAS